MAKRIGVRFSGRFLELARRHMWREEFVPLLLRYLEIRPGQRIVDVGCGTGHLTRLVAQGLEGKGEVVGVDRNEQLLRQGRKLALEAGLQRLVSFRVDDATKMKLHDDFADRVVCQTVMWTVRDPQSVLREMIRICKPGGLVGTVEASTDSINIFYPDDPRLTDLQRAYWRHEAKGFEKLEGLDRNVGYRIPGYLHQLGLKRVRLDAHVRAELDMDDRIPASDKLEMYRYLLYWAEKEGGLSEREKKTLKAGGMKASEMEEFATRYLRFLRNISKSTDTVKGSSLVNARIYFIATGVKPEGWSPSRANAEKLRDVDRDSNVADGAP